jgi:hypothetical protein
MAARRKKGAKRQPLMLTQEALLADQGQSFGPSRRDLFITPEAEKPYKLHLRVLPSMARRGPKGIQLPYFLGMQHWYPMVSEKGKPYRAGVACTDFLQKQHPYQWHRWIDAKIPAVLEEVPCLTCEILRQEEEEDENGDPSWPRLINYMKFNKPSWYWSRSFSFAVIDRDQAEDDPFKIKILPANKTIRDAIMELGDPEGPYPYLFDSEEGNDIMVRRYGSKPYKFQVTPFEKSPVDYKNWEEEMPDLDMVCPNWWTRQETEEWYQTNLPEVLQAKPMAKPKSNSKKSVSKTSVVKSVKSKKPSRKKSRTKKVST